jgi:PTS system galactitol-specific IIB component
MSTVVVVDKGLRKLKTIVIACGIGIATSAMVVLKVKEILKEHQLKANIIQCAIADLASHVDQADLIVTTMKLKKRYSTPTIYGMSLLTGDNVEATKAEILKYLQSDRTIRDEK